MSPEDKQHRQSLPSTIRCATSFLALVLGWLYVGIMSYPLGSASHSGFDGALVATIAGGVGVWAFLTCPRQPRIQRYFALFFAALNVWLAADTLVRYLRFGIQ